MAIVAGTFTTYATKGIREELSDVIYRITPTDTPFMSNAGKGSVDNTYFEWQQDSLAAVDGANAKLEGDDASFTTPAATTRVGNYAMISNKTLVVSGTDERVKKAGRKSEIAYQMAKRSSEIKRDMETILLANAIGNAGAAGTARVTAGLLAWIRTNTDKGATGADPAAPNPYPQGLRTDGTQRAFTETILKNVVQLAWAAGGSPSTLMVNGPQKQVVSGFSGIAQIRHMAEGQKPASIIGAADVYVSDFGAISVVPNRFQRNRDAFVLDFDLVEVDYLRPFQTIELAKTGDAEKRLLQVEYGLRVKHEGGLALAADLT